MNTTRLMSGWRFGAALLLFAGAAASGKLPEPDKLLYGTITLNGKAVTANDGYQTYDVSRFTVEVRTAPESAPLQSYAMGSSLQFNPYFYGLRVTLEAFQERQDADALIGDTLTLVLKEGTNELMRQTLAVTNRGASRIDFGDVADSDGDGLPDLEEVETYNTNPRNTDSDGDGLSDGDEVNLYGTDPDNPDSDGDGQSDGDEVAQGSGPNDPNSYGVGVSGTLIYSGGQTSGTCRVLAVPWPVAEESIETQAVSMAVLEEPGTYRLGPIANGRDYLFFAFRDSNTNGLADTWEAWGAYSNNPVNATGALAGVDIVLTDPDSDGDEIPDYLELFFYGTDPTLTDSDGDGLDDGAEEQAHQTDPNNPDSDGDGLLDGLEIDPWGMDPLNPDSDGDGLPDGWEADTDGDGLVDFREVNEFKTDPRNPDTDGDGLSDGDEIDVYRTNPHNPDTDGDGLSDGDEALAKTDPRKADTDGDGLSDGSEVHTNGTNPTLADSDGDGLSDGREIARGLNPLLRDTDGDGIDDRTEIRVTRTNPNKADTDGDGLADGAEVNIYGTDPKNRDSDGDRLGDGAEVLTRRTNPRRRDTDGDGLSDRRELWRYKSNPRKTDTDGDGLADGAEVNRYRTNPAKADTDGDRLADGAEIKRYGTNPRKADTDGDGLKDKKEFAARTDPHNPDTDGDRLTDGQEVAWYGTDPLNRASRLASISGSIDWSGAPTGRIVVVASRWPSRILELHGGPDGVAVTSLVYTGTGAVRDFTAEGWLLTTASGSNTVISFGRDTLWTLSVAGTLVFDTRDAAGTAHTLKGMQRVNDGQWHHFAVTYNRAAGSKNIYVDGALDVAALAAHAPGAALGLFPPGETRCALIGRGWDLGGAAFEGLLDELRLWKRALPEDEVNRFMSSQPAERRPDLLANWHFDDGTGQDSTAGRRHGVFLGQAGTVEARTVFAGLAQAVRKTVKRAPGIYTINSLPTLRSYAVFAFRDANRNDSRQYWEAFGAATSVVYLAANTGDVNVTIEDTAITTKPDDKDTDGDGLSDALEIFRYGTDPTRFDTDGDLLSDGQETLIYGTDPLLKDTDGDGRSDWKEIKRGADPLDPNSY